MAKMKISYIKPVTLAKFEAVFIGILGLIIAVIALTINSGSEDEIFLGISFGHLSGIVGLFVTPLIYFVCGWIIGYLHAVIYNALTRDGDGIEITTTK